MPQDNGQGTASGALTGGQPATQPQNQEQPKTADTVKAPASEPAAFDYKTSIAPEYHETWTKKGWTNPNDVLKSYSNLENMMGANDRLILPKDDADQRGWDEVYTKMGRPAKAEDYKFEDAPQGVTKNEDLTKWFQQTAHGLGLSQKQAAALEKNWNVFGQELGGRLAEAEKAEVKRQDDALRAEWGPKYEDNLGMARNAASKLGGEKIAAAIDALANQAGYTDVIKMFSNLAKGMGEANFVTGEGQNGFGMNKESAQKEINTLMADPDYMSPNKNPARHRELVEKVTKLFETAYPDEGLKNGSGSFKV